MREGKTTINLIEEVKETQQQPETLKFEKVEGDFSIEFVKSYTREDIKEHNRKQNVVQLSKELIETQQTKDQLELRIEQLSEEIQKYMK